MTNLLELLIKGTESGCSYSDPVGNQAEVISKQVHVRADPGKLYEGSPKIPRIRVISEA